MKLCTLKAEKCRKCVNMVVEDELTQTLSSMTLKEERIAINNIPTFTTKSLNKDIKKEYLKTKTFDLNKTMKSIADSKFYVDEELINENINENPEEESFNTLDECTGQEYYSYLEYTVRKRLILVQGY
jgi:hypothetical protein